MIIPESEFLSVMSPPYSLIQQAIPSHHKKDLVIILQECLGANFVGKLSGQNLTPNIDKLADLGIIFI
jgi:hypothetical protein